MYEGLWINGKRNGKGCYKFKNGNIYEGELLNGNYHGFGKYTYANHNEYLVFEGNWINDKING